MCVAGVVGAWTLPQLGIAFLAVGAVVALNRDLRRAAVVGIAASVMAVLAWYAPHLRQVQESSQIESDSDQHGVAAHRPVRLSLTPALLWIEGTYVIAGLIWLPVVLLSVIVMASSPYLRERSSALILCAGPIATTVFLWATQAYVVPRYLSYLLRAPVRPACKRSSVDLRTTRHPSCDRTNAGLRGRDRASGRELRVGGTRPRPAAPRSEPRCGGGHRSEGSARYSRACVHARSPGQSADLRVLPGQKGARPLAFSSRRACVQRVGAGGLRHTTIPASRS